MDQKIMRINVRQQTPHKYIQSGGVYEFKVSKYLKGWVADFSKQRMFELVFE